MALTKFMLGLDPEIYEQLTKAAKERGINIQEFIRAVIIPDWLRKPVRERESTEKTSLPNKGTVTSEIQVAMIARFRESHKEYFGHSKKTGQGLTITLKDSAVADPETYRKIVHEAREIGLSVSGACLLIPSEARTLTPKEKKREL